MNVNFVSSNDTGEIRTIFVWSDNEEMKQMMLLKGFLVLS